MALTQAGVRPVAVCQQTILPNAVEAVRQGVHQKAPDELASLERHRVALAVLAIGGLPMFRASRGLIVLTATRAYRAVESICRWPSRS